MRLTNTLLSLAFLQLLACQHVCQVVVGPQCGKGYEVNSKGTGCSRCRAGSYKDTDDNVPCTDCPTGQTTVFQGAKSSSLCVPDCQPGTFRAFTKTSTNLQCVPCPIGTYSDTVNARAQCTYCPGGLTTAQTGSTSRSQCRVVCGKGHELNSAGTGCSPCTYGKYKDNNNDDQCTDCPPGQSTAQEGSTSSSQCLNACNPGQFRHYYSHRCYPCPVGEYSDTINARRSCTACPIQITTAQQGSTSSSQCNIATRRSCSTVGLVPTGGYSSYPPPRPSFAHGIPTGYTIKFGCYGGKTLLGPSSATCQDGSWSAQPGSCE